METDEKTVFKPKLRRPSEIMFSSGAELGKLTREKCGKLLVVYVQVM
jgi:hypothetical protein